MECTGRRTDRIRGRDLPWAEQAFDPLWRGRGRSRPATPPDPKSIKLKDPKDWKIAGKPLKRLDTADKLDGSKIFAIDLKLPGMLSAAIKACPVFGGTLKSYDESKIAGMPGVKRWCGSRTLPSPLSPIPGGAPRRRSMRYRSPGMRAPMRRNRVQRSRRCSRMVWTPPRPMAIVRMAMRRRRSAKLPRRSTRSIPHLSSRTPPWR